MTLNKVLNSLGKLTLVSGLLATASLVGNEVSANEEVVHEVETGDTLYKIAEHYDVDMYELAEANDIEDVNLIIVGEELIIEEEAPTQAVSQTVAQPIQEVENQTEEKVQEPVQETTQPVIEETTEPVEQEVQPSTNHSISEAQAKQEIAFRESTNNYYARNGQYIGKYQLDSDYLNGDWSPANQERVVEEYVSSRYKSWNNALDFWNENGYY